MENITVKKVKTQGNIKAYVTVIEGRLTTIFTLVKKDLHYFLNNPGYFDTKLKEKELSPRYKLNGFVDHSYINDAEYKKQIRDYAVIKLGSVYPSEEGKSKP